MASKAQRIDFKKLALYMLKRCWLIILCAAIGFAGLYWYTKYYQKDTYSAIATVYVLNGNPNLVNYQYANASDLNSAVQLLDTYMVVVKSNQVMDKVAEKLNIGIFDPAPSTLGNSSQTNNGTGSDTDGQNPGGENVPSSSGNPDSGEQRRYPGITADYIKSTLSMGSVQETGVLRIRCTTRNPQLSADICNTVVDVAPAQIIDVVGAGSVKVIDYAEVPLYPDYRSPSSRGMLGALVGGVMMAALLALLFLLNHKVTDMESITDNYTPPVLAGIQRSKKDSPNPDVFLLNDDSPMKLAEGYAKLRMNLLYTLVGKEKRVIAVTSPISGEGKSTIAANLAISCAMSGKRVLLIDADLRRACQKEHFHYDGNKPGLSEVLIGDCTWWDAVLTTQYENLDVLPAGHVPPNPAELLSLPAVADLIPELEQHFDLVLIDTPPINVVSDPLVLSSHVAGCVLVVRQNYSNHREIRKALMSAEMTGMNILGFAFYGEEVKQSRYYGDKYYRRYYKNYDNRNKKHKA